MVLKTLKAAPRNEQYITWLFLKTESNFFRNPTEQDGRANFAALCDVAFNIQITSFQEQVIEPLIRLGFLNVLEWVGAKYKYDRRKRGDIFVFPEYLRSLVADIDHHVALPDLPNFRKYIDAVFERRRVTVLVGLEELFGCEGITSASDIIGEIIPQPYLIGKCNSVLAINPRIYTEMKSYFFEKKQAILRSQGSIQQLLNQLNEKYSPDICFKAIDLFPGTFAWKMHTGDKTLSEKDILIILTPWLTKYQIEALRMEASSKFVAIVSAMMGISELNDAFRKVYRTDIQGVDWVVIDTASTPFAERAAAAKPQLLSEFLNMLGLQQITPPIHPPVKPPQPPIVPLPPIAPTTQLILGDKVSSAEMHTLLQQSNLTEDERRNQLIPGEPLIYPLSVAATHTAIFGVNGSGKSVTTKRLAKGLIKYGVPITIIDWHDEYTELIKQLGGIVAVPPTAKIKPSSDEIPFTWNILDPRFYSSEITGEIIDDYIGIVVDLLGHKELMALTEPMKGGFTEALKLVYKNNLSPTFKDVIDILGDITIPPATADALRRRLKRFSSGSLGTIFCSTTSFDPDKMFNKPLDLRVNHLTEEFTSAVGLLTFFLLHQAVAHFKRLGGVVNGQSPVRHVIIVDEAPMVIDTSPRLRKEIVSMLQQMRKFGEGLILVCRKPAIGDDILSETKQMITHTLIVPKDVSYISSTLGLSAQDREMLHSLPRGVAFARIANNPTTLIKVRMD